ncbi:unannotated protein [freshwater metagenome]|uniref:Unannotated protein n=1 Tax=freshwater metagenome TaxID=449393 RepID=A0A6J6DHA6_9ZZZZ
MITSLPAVPVMVAAADTMVATRPLHRGAVVTADAVFGTKTTNVRATVARAAMLIQRLRGALITQSYSPKGFSERLRT